LQEMPQSNSRKFHIGILLPQTKDGGYFQLALSIADSLMKYSVQYKYSLLVYDEKMIEWLKNFNQNIGIIHVERKKFHHKVHSFINVLLGTHVLPASGKKQKSKLKEAGIDLLIIPFPALFGFTENIPYVVTISDVMYQYYPSPEYISLRMKFPWMIVDKYAAKYSTISVADSPQGMDDLHKFLKIPKENIRVIPLMPPGYIYSNQHMDLETAERILAKYKLPERFLFYPSQLCYDKNHLRLIRSVQLIEQRYRVKVPLVLAGLSGESYRDIMNLIHDSGLSDQIIYLGFISGEEVVALYKKAVALAFASICGPTSIPPVEAMILGTPVLYPKIFSMLEQVGEAGVYFDPYSIEDMAEKIYSVWMDAHLRRDLVQKGYQMSKNLTQENYARRWEACIEDAMNKMQKDSSE
jgi:glycosyltransferase involved in cell wall biosynthesis